MVPKQHQSVEIMQASDLVELAGAIALHGQVIIEASPERINASLEQYWLASKCRCDRWGHSLREFRDGKHSDDETVIAEISLLDEIISGEALTRLWTAVLSVHDHRQGADRVYPVANSVLSAHVDFRNRALAMLAGSLPLQPKDARRMLRLHRRVSRWVDLLLAYLQRFDDVSRFAFRPQRCRDFAIDLWYENRLLNHQVSRPLTLISLQAALCKELRPSSPNGDLNFQIGASVLSCFDASQLDATGTFHWLWQYRLVHKTIDCQGLIDELLESA
ncbi:MAG: hypothetical protein VB875_02390 [Pirellulales bacterium]